MKRIAQISVGKIENVNTSSDEICNGKGEEKQTASQ